MFRRRTNVDPTPAPEWQQRFDHAVELISSRPQPAWVTERLDELRRALDETHRSGERFDSAIAGLDPDGTASSLKSTLRDLDRVMTDAERGDLERRVSTLRQRYEAINDMINRREALERQVLHTTADVELLAVQALRTEFVDESGASALDEHFARLQDDLDALQAARREVDRL